MSYKIGILGGSGYTASGLMALLLNHPEVELQSLSSRQLQGQRLGAVSCQYPQLSSLEFCAPDSAELSECDLVFCATPPTVAMQHAPRLRARGVKIVDLSPDFRLQDLELWQRWYQSEHTCPELVREAVYGLPEFHRQRLAGADLIANPGCYATLGQLLLRPLLAQPEVAETLDLDSVVMDAKSGASGAGKKLSEKLLFCEIAENFAPYASSGHRHHPEILAGLALLGSAPLRLVFLPHLLPMIQGLQASIYIPIKRAGFDYQAVYQEFYRSESFVQVLEPGSHPASKAVHSTNYCHIGLGAQQGFLLVMGVIDNLGKGACGQALQNMNLALGLPEGIGLPQR